MIDNPYASLGLTKTATDGEIKKAGAVAVIAPRFREGSFVCA